MLNVFTDAVLDVFAKIMLKSCLNGKRSGYARVPLAYAFGLVK